MKVVFLCVNPVLVSCTKTEVCFEDNIDYYGGDLENVPFDQVPTERDCQARCEKNPDCRFWTWGKPDHSHGPKICFQKDTIQEKKINNKTISGPKFCTSKYTLFWFHFAFLKCILYCFLLNWKCDVSDVSILDWDISCTKTGVCHEDNIDYDGKDLPNVPFDQVPSEGECQDRCKQNPDCKFWTWAKPDHSSRPKICFQKETIGGRRNDSKIISGQKYCGSKYNIYFIKYFIIQAKYYTSWNNYSLLFLCCLGGNNNRF